MFINVGFAVNRIKFNRIYNLEKSTVTILVE